MDSVDILKDVATQFHSVTNKPHLFLGIQNEKSEVAKSALKSLYDLLKKEEREQWQPQDALPRLITLGFDEEQIWQQIELQNEGISNKIVQDVATLLSRKSGLAFDMGPDLSAVDESDASEPTDYGNNSSDDALSDDNREEEEEHKVQFTSEVDDDFFKLCEMEHFCEQVEQEEDGKGNKGEIDLFAGSTDDSDGERELIRYSDFFVPSKQSKKDSHKSRVRFEDEAFSDFSDKEEETGGQSGSDGQDRLFVDTQDSDTRDDGPKSRFEERQDRLKARISALEEAALQAKPWHQQGEVTSAARPHNSLLEEYVEFDRAARPAPVFTEKTTQRLEDIIRQRMKDKAWDDVLRKVKPVENVSEYRKRLVLDQEKSKFSLAEIYEKEYIKQRDATANASAAAVEDEAEPAEHVLIKNMMRTLFGKLDALSNFHYTPKPVAPEIKIISNTRAISMEDVAPLTTSDAALLAPEEVKSKPRGELLAPEERTTTDKNRQRRLKKRKQRLRQKDNAKKEKVVSKMRSGLGNKYSKAKAKQALDAVTKDGQVDRMVATQAKTLKSSQAFFSKLQDQVKTKTTALISVKRKNKLASVSAKKIKL